MRRRIYISYEAAAGELALHMQGQSSTGEVVRDEGARAMRLNSRCYRARSASIDFRCVHTDLLAFAAVLVFHPVLPREAFDLHFVFPVSERLRAALRVPHVLPQATVVSVGNCEPFAPQREAVISYGGGFDSLAAHALLPTLPLVHQTPMDLEGKPFDDVVNGLMADLSAPSVILRDNMRSLYSVWGLPLWVSVYVASLFTQARCIVSGSELTGTYLEGGKGYRPRHNNRWYEAFSKLGVQVLPTSFLSELANAAIVHRAGLESKAAYCALIRHQDCGACTKCLRRRAVRAALAPGRSSLIGDFQRSAQTDAFVRRRPLYYGDVFAGALQRVSERTWLHTELDDLLQRHPRLDHHDGYLARAFDDFAYPAALRQALEVALAQHGLPPLSAEAVARLQAYRQ